MQTAFALKTSKRKARRTWEQRVQAARTTQKTRAMKAVGDEILKTDDLRKAMRKVARERKLSLPEFKSFLRERTEQFHLMVSEIGLLLMAKATEILEAIDVGKIDPAMRPMCACILLGAAMKLSKSLESFSGEETPAEKLAHFLSENTVSFPELVEAVSHGAFPSEMPLEISRTLGNILRQFQPETIEVEAVAYAERGGQSGR